MHHDEDDASGRLNVIHCEDCARRCVDVGSLLHEFGWRSETVAGKARWRWTGCLGSSPDVAMIFKTVRARHGRAA